MHFSLPLIALLFALARVGATPVKRSSPIVTLPLKRLRPWSNVHPSVLLQRHINRSRSRHAHMSGLDGPSNAELERRLHCKRSSRIDTSNYEKRYDHIGVDRISAFDDEAVNLEDTSKPGSRRRENGTENGNPNSNVLVSNQNTTTSRQGFSKAKLDAQKAGGVTPANSPSTKNSLGLRIEAGDIGYIATVEAGTPPRSFSILVDSGSADFWINGEGCQSPPSADCGNHVYLGPQSSSTFQDSNKMFKSTYGSGEVEGDIISDNVNIAGFSLDQHVFGVALLESSEFSDTVIDGLMGLARSTISAQGVLTPIESLAKLGLIDEAITSYKLGRASDGNNDGEITFGGLDESKFDPSTLVTFPNVSPNGFWEGGISVSVDGKDLGLQGRTAILDTGTTLLYVPSADAEAIHAQIPGSKSCDGYFTIPCTSASVVSLTFGGRAFDINPIDLLFYTVDENNLQGECVSSITPGRFGGPKQWLVGDVFLKNAYFSTNVNTNKISLAKLV